MQSIWFLYNLNLSFLAKNASMFSFEMPELQNVIDSKIMQAANGVRSLMLEQSVIFKLFRFLHRCRVGSPICVRPASVILSHPCKTNWHRFGKFWAIYRNDISETCVLDKSKDFKLEREHFLTSSLCRNIWETAASFRPRTDSRSRWVREDVDEDVSAETVVAHSRLHRERYWREVCFCSIHANCPLFKLVLERFKLVNWFLIIVEREDVILF